MNFITGTDRNQTYFATLNDQVAVDNPVRLIDAFIDKLDLQQLGFGKTCIKGSTIQLLHQAYFLLRAMYMIQKRQNGGAAAFRH
jgi:hypothetical protein